MTKLTLFLTVFLVTVAMPTAHASGIWQRLFQDVKLPSQVVLEHKSWTNPVAASATRILNDVAATNGAVMTYTTFSAQPDFARNLTITPTGTTGNVGAGDAIVTGTDIFGNTMTETFVITAGQAYALVGAKAFKSVSSIVFPAPVGTGVTVRAGVSTKLGIHRCTDFAGALAWSVNTGVYEATRGVLVSHPSVIGFNTFVPNGSQDAANDFDVYFVQNYGCGPN